MADYHRRCEHLPELGLRPPRAPPGEATPVTGFLVRYAGGAACVAVASVVVASVAVASVVAACVAAARVQVLVVVACSPDVVVTQVHHQPDSDVFDVVVHETSIVAGVETLCSRVVPVGTNTSGISSSVFRLVFREWD